MCMQFICFFEKCLWPHIQGNNGTKSVNSRVDSLKRSYCLYAKCCKCLICMWRHFVKLKTAATAAPPQCPLQTPTQLKVFPGTQPGICPYLYARLFGQILKTNTIPKKSFFFFLLFHIFQKQKCFWARRSTSARD